MGHRGGGRGEFPGLFPKFALRETELHASLGDSPEDLLTSLGALGEIQERLHGDTVRSSEALSVEKDHRAPLPGKSALPSVRTVVVLSLKRPMSASFYRIYFPILASLLCWYHKCTPGKAIVSWQCRSRTRLPAESRCSSAQDPRPGTLEAGNPVGLQLPGERDLGGTSCCP